ncbi:NAD-specific glutamate dehydrogenase, putative [Babesia ovata]|uniref:NAD-specific glutamate dehydrogenase, putative n=1 Tax=Babesia ovata TaxID=189622 RepID=A0A2H6K727_9APIC|nr:NAD-specific glutamate dehydrogenase, putative [Babesia ovata]GBE58785.1 NAD-specific glutamate dehydrogenase, putative [Babesia ovata]
MVYHDIVRLHVPVHDALAVRVVDCLEELVHVILDVGESQHRVQDLEIRVVDIFEYQRRRPALRVLDNVQEFDDVGSAAQVLENLNFTFNLLFLEWFEYFDHNPLLRGHVGAFKHLAVLPPADFSHDLIVVRDIPHERDVLVVPVVWALLGVDIGIVFGENNGQVHIGIRSAFISVYVHCDSLIGVDSVVGLLSEELLDHFSDLGDTGGTSDEHDLLDLALGHLDGLEHILDGVEGLYEQVLVEAFELGPGEGLAEVLSVDEVLNLDGGLGGGRQVTLGGLDLLAQLLHSLLVLHDVDTVLLLEYLDEVVHHTPVEVLTTQVGVTGSTDDLEDTGVQHKNGHIKGTTSKIVHKDVRLHSSAVDTVGNGSGGGLVDDAHHLEASDGTGILSGLALRIVEVRRHSNDGLVHFLTEVVLGDLLHLLEHHGADLLRRVILGLVVVLDLDVGPSALVDNGVRQELHVVLHLLVVELASNEPLDVEDSVGVVDGGVTFGSFSHLGHVVHERDVRGGDTVSHFVGDDLHPAVLVDTDTGVGGTQVNTDDGSLDCKALIDVAITLTLSRSGVGNGDAAVCQGQACDKGHGRCDEVFRKHFANVC